MFSSFEPKPKWHYCDHTGTCWQVYSHPILFAARQLPEQTLCICSSDVPSHVVRFLQANPHPKYLPKLPLSLLRHFCGNALKGQHGQVDNLLIDRGNLRHALQWLDLHKPESAADDYCIMLRWHSAIKFFGRHWRIKIQGMPLDLHLGDVGHHKVPKLMSMPKLISRPGRQPNSIQVDLKLP